MQKIKDKSKMKKVRHLLTLLNIHFNKLIHLSVFRNKLII